MKELYAHPGMGLLGHEFWIGNPFLSVQYWHSFEALLKYAGNKERQHLPAWIAFKDSYSKNAAVGIWHEAYLVEPGGFETTYKNMPAFGLGRATKLELYCGPYVRLAKREQFASETPDDES